MAEDFKIIIGTEVVSDVEQSKQAIKELQNQADKANVNVKIGAEVDTKALEKAQKQLAKAQEKNVKYVAKQTKTLDNLYSKTFNQKNPLTGNDAKKVIDRFTKLRTTLNSIGAETNESVRQQIDVKINSLKNTIKELQNIQSTLNTGPQKTIGAIDGKIGKLTAFASYSAIENAPSGSGLDALKNKILDLRSSYEKLQLELSSTDINTDQFRVLATNLSAVDERYKEVEASAKKYATTESTMQTLSKSAAQIAEVQTRLKNIGTNYSALKTNPAFLAEFERLVAAAKNLDSESVGAFSAQVTAFQKSLKAAGLDHKDYFGEITDKARKFNQWFDVSRVIMVVYSSVQKAGTELKTLDSTLTEVSKTSDRTKKALDELQSSSFGVASTYGVKANDYLTGVQEFSRAGFGAGADEALSKLALQAQAAGDMSAELSQDYLLAANAAYKLKGDATALTEMLDGMNMITNRNATSMVELAEGFKVVASQAAGASVEANQLAAAIGTIDAVTRQGGNVAGRGFRTILMNLQGASAIGQVTEDGEEITIESVGKLGKALESLGVTSREFKNGVEVLRDPIEILKELSEAFTALDENDSRRSELLSALGGKYRANTAEALLSNWDMYEKMVKDYSEGGGSSFEEAMKSANNLQGSLNRLENTWTSVVSNFANSSTMTFVVNLANGFLSLADAATKLTGSMGPLANPGLLAGLFAGIKNVGKPEMAMPCYTFVYGSRAA